jgi:hypothetical protein
VAPIPVLDKQKKGKTHQGYHWVYYSPEEQLVLFDYQKGRSREDPKELLKGYQGYLQTDGYQAISLKTGKILSWWGVLLMLAGISSMLKTVILKDQSRHCF